MTPGRPDADECLPYYSQYIARVPDGNVLDLLAPQITDTAAYLSTFTPEQETWREGPDEWNMREIVGHLADTERVFGYRALVIARADPHMWNNVEFDDGAPSRGPERRRPCPPPERRERSRASNPRKQTETLPSRTPACP